MLNVIDDSNPSKAMDKFYDETNLLTGCFRRFCDELIHVMVAKYSPEIWKGYAEEIQFAELEKFATSKIHWFVDTTEQKQTNIA